ncbi:MAG TPA: hypothetical protein VJT82_10405 [Pyrinomonadaceae bacterium]|nr:hypothetical protein [Pyrinomonadaceae bacterium]
MIVEGFDNAWHILRHWSESGYKYFRVDATARIPQPSPLRREEVPADAVPGLDYFPIPPLADAAPGDNPGPDRPLTVAEILLATAIAEGWEMDQSIA